MQRHGSVASRSSLLERVTGWFWRHLFPDVHVFDEGGFDLSKEGVIYRLAVSGKLTRETYARAQEVLMGQPHYLLRAICEGIRTPKHHESPVAIHFLKDGEFESESGERDAHTAGTYCFRHNHAHVRNRLEGQAFAETLAHEIGHSVSDLFVLDDHRELEFTKEHDRLLRRHWLFQMRSARHDLEDADQREAFQNWWRVACGKDRNAKRRLLRMEEDLIAVVKKKILYYFPTEYSFFGPGNRPFPTLSHDIIAEHWAEVWSHFTLVGPTRDELRDYDPLMHEAMAATFAATDLMSASQACLHILAEGHRHHRLRM